MYIYRVIVSLVTVMAFTECEKTSQDIEIDSILKGEPCTMEDGTVGTCLMYNECQKNKTVDTSGTKIPVYRIGSCSKYLHVCCSILNRDTYLEEKKKGCGWRNVVSVLNESLTDDVAQFGEFPWTVAILRKETITLKGEDKIITRYKSGGSIIHPSVVLTAAHVVSAYQDLLIRAGEWNTQSIYEPYPHQDRMVDEIVIHPQYNPKNLFNDIALLFLSHPVGYAPNVGVVCLPPQDLRVSEGATCVSTGWGKNRFGKSGRYQSIMKKVQLPVISNDNCQSALRKTRLSKHFTLNPRFMCAGGEAGKDACQGDGGSPLVCRIEPNTDRYMQSGIVAWGIDCGTEVPGVYTNISVFRQWVDENVKRRGYDPSFYTY
ncbi:unnamed protein product [Euphydryas editha]|uniref:Phenoloxidase-activating factor 2 n=1 Tax=Euphydryas editha TaxID=104508 RepID=A0AAU9UMZ2_EUPED|nr:unnamed protein product [Euphydryas editha]